MIELPEALNLAKQMRENLIGRKVVRVLPPTKKHKFCWFCGYPTDYDAALCEKKITDARGFGIFAELSFEGGKYLCINDGVNPRLCKTLSDVPKDYQLLIELDGGAALVFTVAMYGGIYLHNGDYSNEYYLSSKEALSPIENEAAFGERYNKVMSESKQNLSAKAFLATEQRFPGIGNGVLQDILFEAHIHPKRKLQTLAPEEKKALLDCTLTVLHNMTSLGGRDTEKDLLGNIGGYKTKMSKNALPCGCPICGGTIVKEAYLGGSVYYCPACQKL